MRLLQAVAACATLGAGLTTALTLTSSTGCSDASSVRQVFAALDGAGNRPRNVFFTDTSLIYCDIVFSGHGTDQTIDVTFLQTTGESTLYDGLGDVGPIAGGGSHLWSVGEGAPGAGIQIASFSFNPPSLVEGGTTLPYPVGHYKCLVSVNGQAAGETDFDVNYPAQAQCTASGGAYDGLSCLANKIGDSCPSDTNYAPGTTQCQCQSPGDPLARVFVCQ